MVVSPLLCLAERKGRSGLAIFFSFQYLELELVKGLDRMKSKFLLELKEGLLYLA